jgi:hypothetical protein
MNIRYLRQREQSRLGLSKEFLRLQRRDLITRWRSVLPGGSTI